MRKWIPNIPAGLELLPLAAEDGSAFLRTFDCFLYRTSDQWFETFERVVFEAMACGLPVVAHRLARYSHFLRDGEDVLLFDTDEESFTLVMRLKTDAGLSNQTPVAGDITTSPLLVESDPPQTSVVISLAQTLAAYGSVADPIDDDNGFIAFEIIFKAPPLYGLPSLT